MVFDVPRHQPAFLGFGVGLLEAGEIDVRPGQRKAGGLLVLLQAWGVDAGDLVEVVVEPSGSKAASRSMSGRFIRSTTALRR